jgi:hypothetical protein
VARPAGRTALATAPAGLRGRLEGRLAPGLASGISSARQGVLLVAALMIGTATHLGWGEFTHARRWDAEHVAALAQSWEPLPGYRWLQYASSVVGLVVLLAWFVRWWRRTSAVPASSDPAARWAGGTVLLAAVLLAICRRLGTFWASRSTNAM